jgi:hypothetical protein
MAFYDAIIPKEHKDFWISTVFIIVTLLLSEFFRLSLKYTFPKETLLKRLLKEFIVSGELCGCCFELCISKNFIKSGFHMMYE